MKDIALHLFTYLLLTMSALSDEEDHLSPAAAPAYRLRILPQNGIVFLDRQAFREEPFLRRFKDVERRLSQVLCTALDRSVIISEKQLETLELYGDIVTYQDNGYTSSAVVEHALRLREKVRRLENAAEHDWIHLFIVNVWEFFQMRPTFSYRYIPVHRQGDQQWTILTLLVKIHFGIDMT